MKLLKQIPRLIVTITTSATLLVSTLVFSVPANAATVSELRQQREALEQQIQANRQTLSQLASQADTYQRKIAQLNVDIENANAEIEATALRITELEQQLDATQKELDRQKGLLKDALRELYKQTGSSPVELLLASDSFGDYINDQEYLERLKTGIQNSTEKVIALKAQLEEQKTEQQQLKLKQEENRNALNGKQQEQQQLLDATRGDEARYKQYTEDLKRQQAAVNAELASRLRAFNINTGDGRGGYPDKWALAPQDSMLDDWGMYNRECVSYTAFRVWADGKNMPYWGGHGNANQWPASARAEGFRVDSTPERGAVAISMAGYYGHAMYIEHVNGDGTIYVSQYNFTLNGTYSEMTIYTSGLLFIHFPDVN